jgi:uncharacterized membrane protein
MQSNYLSDPRFLLRLGPALMMIIFGIDQLRNPQNWFQYLPRQIPNLLRMSPSTIMRVHAVFNVLIGFWLLSGWTQRVATWIALLWLISILPFAFMGDWTVGVRDSVIVLSVIALLFLLQRGN